MHANLEVRRFDPETPCPEMYDQVYILDVNPESTEQNYRIRLR